MTDEPAEQAHPLDTIIINQSNRIDELEAELALFRQSASAQLMAKVVSAHQNKIEELKAELARYEAMMGEMEEVFLTGGKVDGTGIRGLRDCGESWSYFTDSGYTDNPEWKTPLDAYTALKEATP